MKFNTIFIIGLGLIGGSFARLIKNNNKSLKIIAHDLDKESLAEALKDKVIDGVFDLKKDNINNLPVIDLIVIATPISSYSAIFDNINLINKDAKVIDLGSVKNFKFKNTPKNFTPCHPIAGSEKSGFENSNFELFSNSKLIVCKKEQNLDQDLKAFFVKNSLKIEYLDAKTHDEIYGLISHLPQFLSFLLSDFVPKNLDNSFKKPFRLIESDPKMWQDIFNFNQSSLEKYYNVFFENLDKNLALLKNRSQIENLLTYSDKLRIENNDSFNNYNFNEKFFEDNFDVIFFHFLVVISYLEIEQIKLFKNYHGNGFRDFTSLINLLDFDHEKIINLAEKNSGKINKIFKEIS